MFKRSREEIVHKLKLGLNLRCPNCEQGSMFDGLFGMRRECDVCGVRFERRSGESVGGMYLNLGIAEMIAIPGYFIVNALFHPPFLPHLLFWFLFTVVFCTLFYSRARGLWVAITYLTGGVQTDQDYEASKPATVTSPFSDEKTP